MSSNKNISISLPTNNTYVKNGNFTTTKENGVNKVVFNPVVGNSIFDFQSNTQYKLPIRLSYNLGKDIDGDEIIDTFTTTINWTLTPIKGLQDVELFVDKRVVNTSIAEKHSLRVGYYLISSNTPKKFIGNKDEDNINGYKIILTDDIQNLSSGEVSVWENAEYDFVKNGENRNCYVVLVKSDGKTIVDYINITSINDGKSAIHLELTQDYIAIPCDQNGNIHEKFDGDISSQMILYNGDKVIENNENNISYNFKIGDKDITSDVILSTDGKIYITKDKIKELIHGDTNIECIATYNGSSFHKTIFIDFDVLPYEIEMNKNTLTRDVNEGKIIDEFILVRVKYWDGSQGKWIYTDKGNVILNSVNGQENITFELIDNSEKFDRKIIIAETLIANNNIDTEFRISYYNEKGEELSYDTIGIINTGKNGETPSCKETIILGYSTENIDVDSTEWKATLDELGTLSPGQPIYILNEYTWNNDDETTSRGITVTLAGTQGVDGKSRVLFYLGSFQDGTLKGEKVEGKLDDERCDYYIDSNGDAWMRTGLNESADGYPSGSSLDSTNWKPSTKVGFLQSGAITADMINAQTITSDSGIVTKLFSQEIVSKNLTVDAAQITGTLDANEVNITNLTVDATQITGTLDAQKINTDGLTVSKLNTKPENNKDNISICENYIYCLNGDGRRNLKISSDNINIGCLDALFTPVNSVDVNKYVAINGWTNNNNKWTNTNIVLSSQGTVNVNNDETADPVNYNGTCKPIGYVLKDTKFDMTIKISLNYYYWGNSVQPYTKISADKWGITSGTAQGWGKLPVGSSALTNSNLTGGYLLLYKKDENGIYVLVKLYSLSGEWIIENSDSVIFNPNSNFTSGNYRTKHVTDIQIPDDGEYGVELYFEPNSIYYTNTTNPSSNTYLNTRFIINVNRPEQYTEIGKNGLISYNIDTAIALNSDGVILKSKNADDGIYNFYGLKVNKSGIYIGTNTTDWKKLNLDKMIELGIIEDIPE